MIWPSRPLRTLARSFLNVWRVMRWQKEIHQDPSSIVPKAYPDLYAAKQTCTLCFVLWTYPNASKNANTKRIANKKDADS
jgi:hypothetical protein